MARIRTIKPEMTHDEDFAKLGFAARYFFTHLLCHCDREGRAEDRPQKLQILILPWDKIDVDILLTELSPKFLVRYEVGSKRYIQVVKFSKHQRPHVKENPSEIPPMPGENQAEPGNSGAKPGQSGSRTLDKWKGTDTWKGNEIGMGGGSEPPRQILPNRQNDTVDNRATSGLEAYPPSEHNDWRTLSFKVRDELDAKWRAAKASVNAKDAAAAKKKQRASMCSSCETEPRAKESIVCESCIECGMCNKDFKPQEIVFGNTSDGHEILTCGPCAQI